MTKDRAPLGDRRYKINKQKAVAEKRDLVKELSWTKNGHPKHPLYIPYSAEPKGNDNG